MVERHLDILQHVNFLSPSGVLCNSLCSTSRYENGVEKSYIIFRFEYITRRRRSQPMNQWNIYKSSAKLISKYVRHATWIKIDRHGFVIVTNFGIIWSVKCRYRAKNGIRYSREAIPLLRHHTIKICSDDTPLHYIKIIVKYFPWNEVVRGRI